MVSATRFRELALSFEGTLEVPHMERAAFRTKRRIFATLPPDGRTANLMLDLDFQEALCAALGDAFSPVPGGWGRMGATTVDLRVVSLTDLRRALGEAHARASEPKTPAKRPAAKPKRKSTRK